MKFFKVANDLFVLLVLIVIVFSPFTPSPQLYAPRSLDADPVSSTQQENKEQEAPYYNEVFYPDGTVREKYKDAYDWVSKMSKKEYKEYIANSKKLLSGDTPMGPLPRIFYESEYALLKKGTEQRAKAIQAFLNDHYSGKQSYRDKVVPGPIIDEIIGRTGEADLFPLIQKNLLGKFRFLYGPDLIRGRDGTFYVLEDNLGFVGGTPGDTIPARETFEGLMPEMSLLLDIKHDPKSFLTGVMDKTEATANPKLGFHSNEGAYVMLANPPYGDKEDVRMADQFKKRGMILVTPNTRNKKLIVRADGVYLTEKTKYGGQTERKVGMLWMNAEHAWLDWNNPAIREKAIMDEAKDYLDETGTSEISKKILLKGLELDPKTQRVDLPRLEKALQYVIDHDFPGTKSVLKSKAPYEGLLQAVLDGRVQSNYTPGTEFIGDKMFHTYMEDLIHFYLKEEPILRNPKTERFFTADDKGNLTLDENVLKKTIDKKREKRVVKIVDGRGGDGIHIGPKMTPEQWKDLDPIIREQMMRYVSQKFIHPSVLSDGHNEWIVDHRMFTYIDEKGALVSGGWGRSNLTSGDGKVNMSKNGTLSLILVVPDCAAAFEKMGKEGELLQKFSVITK